MKGQKKLFIKVLQPINANKYEQNMVNMVCCQLTAMAKAKLPAMFWKSSYVIGHTQRDRDQPHRQRS